MHFFGLRLATPAARDRDETQSREPARLRRFCRRRAVHYAISPLRFRAALASAVVSARPPFTSACLIDADASLGRTQPLDFCNEFSKYDTRARLPRALSSPAARDCLAVVATHDALFTLLGSSSFGCKEDSSSMRRSELRVIPRRSASRAEPRSPRASPPRATPFKWARRTWETRRPKEPSKGERTRSRDRV